MVRGVHTPCYVEIQSPDCAGLCCLCSLFLHCSCVDVSGTRWRWTDNRSDGQVNEGEYNFQRDGTMTVVTISYKKPGMVSPQPCTIPVSVRASWTQVCTQVTIVYPSGLQAVLTVSGNTLTGSGSISTGLTYTISGTRL